MQLDSTLIAQWQQDGRYDYDRELTTESPDVSEWLWEHLRQFLGDLFDTTIDNDAFKAIMVIAGLLILALIGWGLWKRGVLKMLWHGERQTVDYTVEEDTIYGVDFDAELRKALDRHDYRQAVRWLYLQTLWLLSQRNRIDWQPQKTPRQYQREAKDEAFSRLSNHFVRVRYGNFGATAEMVEEMKQLQQQIGKGGEVAQ